MYIYVFKCLRVLINPLKKKKERLLLKSEERPRAEHCSKWMWREPRMLIPVSRFAMRRLPPRLTKLSAFHKGGCQRSREGLAPRAIMYAYRAKHSRICLFIGQPSWWEGRKNSSSWRPKRLAWMLLRFYVNIIKESLAPRHVLCWRHTKDKVKYCVTQWDIGNGD